MYWNAYIAQYRFQQLIIGKKTPISGLSKYLDYYVITLFVPEKLVLYLCKKDTCLNNRHGYWQSTLLSWFLFCFKEISKKKFANSILFIFSINLLILSLVASICIELGVNTICIFSRLGPHCKRLTVKYLLWSSTSRLSKRVTREWPFDIS